MTLNSRFEIAHRNWLSESNQSTFPAFHQPVRIYLLAAKNVHLSSLTGRLRTTLDTLRQPIVHPAPDGIACSVWAVHRNTFRGTREESGLERG